MQKKWYLLISLVVIIGIVLYSNYVEDTKGTIKSELSRKYVHSLKFENTFPISIASTDEFFFNNQIFLKDYANQQIVVTNLEGKTLRTYGRRGEGPKENLLIRGFYADNLSYYTSDAEKNTISRISFQDSLLYYYKPDFQIGISGFLKGGSIIVKGSKVQGSNTQLVFYLINPILETKHEIDLSDFYDVNRHYSDIIFDGFFGSTPDGGLLYVPHYNNRVVKFSQTGEIEYSSKLIYDVPVLELSIRGSMVFPSGNDTPHFYSVSANEKYFFIQSSIGDKKYGTQTMIVDIYDLKNGSYSSSIRIPINENGFFPNTVRVHKNKLYLFYENHYEIFKIV